MARTHMEILAEARLMSRRRAKGNGDGLSGGRNGALLRRPFDETLGHPAEHPRPKTHANPRAQVGRSRAT